MLNWLDKRLSIVKILKTPSLPRGTASWHYFLGFMAFLFFLLQFATNIFVYLDSSHPEIAKLYVFKLHKAISQSFLIFATLHMLRNLFIGSYQMIRELHWFVLFTIFILAWVNYYFGSRLYQPHIHKNPAFSLGKETLLIFYNAVFPFCIYSLYMIYFWLLKKTGLDNQRY